jgi:hypothetical protein
MRIQTATMAGSKGRGHNSGSQSRSVITIVFPATVARSRVVLRNPPEATETIARDVLENSIRTTVRRP